LNAEQESPQEQISALNELGGFMLRLISQSS
jgi:hypothetical protein